MTRDGFHALLIAPSTGETLDRWLEEDEALKQRLQRERNEEIYLRAIRNFWRAGTDSPVPRVTVPHRNAGEK